MPHRILTRGLPLLLMIAAGAWAGTAEKLVTLSGHAVRPDGAAVVGATVRVAGQEATTDGAGRFTVDLPPGSAKIEIMAASFRTFTLPVNLISDLFLEIHLEPAADVTVHPAPDVLTPDPSTRTFAPEDVLEANPGRPGVLVSVPGAPAETASGGIKAPQYFAPGVASDHGVLIAQFLQVGDFVLPNNLTANAHGNGYADPNPVIPATIGSVGTDGGAFNVRYGDHAVDLSTTYGLRPRIGTFAEFSGDSRDFDMVVGWTPARPDTSGWLAAEGSFGNGNLSFAEHRQQEKINGQRIFNFGRHELTLYGIGYYGYSRIPGLVPIGVPVPSDTIDARQMDLTHTSLLALSDTYTLSDRNQLRFAGFFRTYSLRLRSNFGDGLIQQDEFRTVAGGNAAYVYTPRRSLSFLAGLDLQRDAIPDLNLRHLDSQGAFQLVTSNDLTLGSVSPFVSVNAKLTRFFECNLGVRRDQFFLNNRDLLNPANSYILYPGVTSPKATLTLLPSQRHHLPTVAFSFGDAFHFNDPRIGAGSSRGAPVAISRAYQLVATEVLAGTEFQLALAHVSNTAQLAQIDPDTGLQNDLGPSRIRSLTFSARRWFGHGSVQASFARADAHDLLTGQPVPEAPRIIWDVSTNWEKLPLGLRMKNEMEYVGAKPLGDGFVGVPVKEFRGALLRSFGRNRMEAGVNFLVASGFTGQTLETLALPGEANPFERIVGVRLKSYASLSFTYHFGAEHIVQ